MTHPGRWDLIENVTTVRLCQYGEWRNVVDGVDKGSLSALDSLI